MTEQEFLRISFFIKSRYGIDLSRKKEIVQGRLEKYVRDHNFKSYSEYMNAVEADFSGMLERELVDILTTNHTFFMREFEHFEYLKQVVLPELKKKEEGKKDIGIWCGAASTGQEPYMLAMLLKDFFGLEHGAWDTKILATDISTDALKTAMEGIYTGNQTEVLPVGWKRRFLRTLPDGEKVEIKKEIKDEVLFRQFNLMDNFPFKRKLHIVFMRNVMIYFDKETKQELIRKIYDVMQPGGYLFVGKTETIDRGAAPFELVEQSIFRKKEGTK